MGRTWHCCDPDAFERDPPAGERVLARFADGRTEVLALREVESMEAGGALCPWVDSYRLREWVRSDGTVSNRTPTHWSPLAASDTAPPWAKPLAERPFSHTSTNGTRFRCARADLAGTIEVLVPVGLPRKKLVADVAEMTGYHAAAIRPDLTGGFAGYDCLTFDVK